MLAIYHCNASQTHHFCQQMFLIHAFIRRYAQGGEYDYATHVLCNTCIWCTSHCVILFVFDTYMWQMVLMVWGILSISFVMSSHIFPFLRSSIWSNLRHKWCLQHNNYFQVDHWMIIIPTCSLFAREVQQAALVWTEITIEDDIVNTKSKMCFLGSFVKSFGGNI